MRTQAIVFPGEPGSFTLTDADPMYYTERLSYILTYNIWALKEAGFEFVQIEPDDVDTMQSDLTTYLGTFGTWLQGAVQAQAEGGTPSVMPMPPDLPTIPIGNTLLGLVINRAIQLVLKWVERSLDGSTDTSELVTAFKQAFFADGQSVFTGGSGEDIHSVFVDGVAERTLTESLTAMLATLVDSESGKSLAEIVADFEFEEGGQIEELSEDWKTWIDNLGSYLADLELWGGRFVDAFETNVDENEDLNVPIPLPPTLPAPPPVGGPLSAIVSVIVFLIKWIGTHRDLIIKILKILQILNKLREIIRGGEDASELFKKAFLYDEGNDKDRSVLKDGLLFSDPQDDKLKGTLERGLLVTITGPNGTETKGLLDLRLRDLLYTDGEIELPGNVRYYIHSKVVSGP